MKLIVALLALTLITGCDAETTDKAAELVTLVKAKISHILNKDDRDAILKVENELKIAMEKFDTPPDASVEQVRSSLENFHEMLLNIDISKCPEDFRSQYRMVVVASREFSEAVNRTPGDVVEYLDYLLSQGNSANPDITGERAQQTLTAKYENLQFEFQELDAVAKRYE